MSEVIRVLLADGHAVVRDALRALIHTAPDMEVVGEAADGTGVLEQALQRQPDVIVLDHSTLGNDWLTTLISLIKFIPQPCILILSNKIDEREISAIIDAGVKGYLLKGTAASEILQAIRKLYIGESIFDPVVTISLLQVHDDQRC